MESLDIPWKQILDSERLFVFPSGTSLHIDYERWFRSPQSRVASWPILEPLAEILSLCRKGLYSYPKNTVVLLGRFSTDESIKIYEQRLEKIGRVGRLYDFSEYTPEEVAWSFRKYMESMRYADPD